MRNTKSSRQRDEDGRIRKFGRNAPHSVWSSKLRCSCGSSFRRFQWHKNEDGSKTYGYECYRQKRTVSGKYLEANGLESPFVCHQKSIPFWHIDLMAYMVFNTVWKERRDAVLLACQMIEACAVAETHSCASTLAGLKQKRERLQKQQEGLRAMCALGDISREEFLNDKQKLQEQITQLDAQIEDLSTVSAPVSPVNMAQIRSTLDQWVDLSMPVISDHLIEQFILQVVAIDDTTYNWTLNLSPTPSDDAPPASEIARRQYHEQKSGGKYDTRLHPSISDPKEIFSFTVTEADARAYCERIGIRFFAKRWQDKQVIISI